MEKKQSSSLYLPNSVLVATNGLTSEYHWPAPTIQEYLFGRYWDLSAISGVGSIAIHWKIFCTDNNCS